MQFVAGYENPTEKYGLQPESRAAIAYDALNLIEMFHGRIMLNGIFNGL